MKLIDITPKTKFYIITDGKIMAVHFSSLQVQLEHFFVEADHLDVNGKFFVCLTTAEGKEIGLNNVEFRTTAFYKTAQDALNRQNRVVFTLKQADMPILLDRCGAKIIYKEERGGSGAIFHYAVWRYVKEGAFIGARLIPISFIDLLSNEISLEGYGNEGYTTDWHNTKEECDAKGQKNVEVVDFDDKPTEDEQPNNNDDMGVHIVFIKIVK